MRVLVFGDSIAQGFWSVDGGWVEKLRRHYDSLAIADLKNNKQPEIFNLGVSGDTTRNLLSRIGPETKARKWPGDSLVVLLAIGTNDELFQNKRQIVPPDEFKTNIQKILSILSPIADNIMLIGNAACEEKLTTPVFWGDIYYTNEQIKKYEDYIAEIARSEKIAFVPIFEKFSNKMKNKQLLADGLHPNDEGHEFIFQLVQPQLDKLLSK